MYTMASGKNDSITVLIVEDDQSCRDSLASALQELGFRAITAVDGADAQQRLSTNSVDIIISDLMMPKVNGLELLHFVKAHHATIPFILVTAFANSPQAKDALASGAYECLAKPIDLIELEAVVLRAVHVD